MSTRLHHRQSLNEYRRALRHELTPQERMLWSRLRANATGVRFRRQHSVGLYILDFYCPAQKLAVEIDGAQHLDAVSYDTQRTEYLERVGVRVLRFGNDEVNTNMDGVMLAIWLAIGGG